MTRTDQKEKVRDAQISTQADENGRFRRKNRTFFFNFLNDPNDFNTYPN